MRYRLPVCTVVICLALMMQACGHRESPPAPPVEHLSATTLQNGDQKITVTLPETIKQLDEVTIGVTIQDSKNAPVENCSIVANLTMPDMSMPLNSVQLKDMGRGIHGGKLRFTMAGKWQITLGVISRDSSLARIKMPLVTVE